MVLCPLVLLSSKRGQYITWFTPAAALKKTDLQSFYESGFGKHFLPNFVDTDNHAMWLLSTLAARHEEGVAAFAVESNHSNSQLAHATLEVSKLMYLRATKDMAPGSMLRVPIGTFDVPNFLLDDAPCVLSSFKKKEDATNGTGSLPAGLASAAPQPVRGPSGCRLAPSCPAGLCGFPTEEN